MAQLGAFYGCAAKVPAVFPEGNEGGRWLREARKTLNTLLAGNRLERPYL